MKEDSYPLEPDAAGMREMAGSVLESLIDFVEGLEDAPSTGAAVPPALLEALSRPPPEEPGHFGDLLAMMRTAADASYETAAGSYLAYIPGGGIFSAALAEFFAAVTNRYTGKATFAPPLVAMESAVLRWMCDLFEFPVGSQGVLTTGGSMSNLIALTAARTQLAEGQVDRATVYVGEHAHASLAKAARIAGVQRQHVRTVASTDDLRLDVDHLRELLREDRRAGLIPVAVCAASGTTNTGTIDPLVEVGEVAREEGVWYHIDGAYGGFFQLTERGHERLEGITSADSIALDPHKALFLPYGTGALVVRSADALRATFSESADYLQDLGERADLPDFDALTPELTRDFRGLRLWLPLHLHGVDAFRRQLDEKLDLAVMVYDRLSANPLLEVRWRPDLSIVPFRLAHASEPAQKELLQRINQSGRVLLSSTRLAGDFFLRVAVLSARTHEERIRELFEIIEEAARAIAD